MDELMLMVRTHRGGSDWLQNDATHARPDGISFGASALQFPSGRTRFLLLHDGKTDSLLVVVVVGGVRPLTGIDIDDASLPTRGSARLCSDSWLV